MNRLPKALDDKDFTPGSVWGVIIFIFQSVLKSMHQNDPKYIKKN